MECTSPGCVHAWTQELAVQLQLHAPQIWVGAGHSCARARPNCVRCPSARCWNYAGAWPTSSRRATPDASTARGTP
eukprot:11194774-Lingulodinium_polyedra.AAC.1